MSDTHGVKFEPELAVDLDGTLAEYHGWQGINHIGKVIPKMRDRVLAWQAKGITIVVFTARVSGDDAEEVIMATKFISNWIIANGMAAMEITCIKKKQFKQIWDDRAIQIIPNTGISITGADSYE